jgi:hypothetical protein
MNDELDDKEISIPSVVLSAGDTAQTKNPVSSLNGSNTKNGKNGLGEKGEKGKVLEEELKKFVEKVPYFKKYNLKHYFDMFRLREEELSAYLLKQKILAKTIHKYVKKVTTTVLQRRFKKWCKSLTLSTAKSITDTETIMHLNAVDELKNLLQKRYAKYPVDLFKSKVNSSNYDWGARFALGLRRKVLTGTIREYIARWRNNQLESLVRDNLKKIYTALIYRFSKRYALNQLRKRFNQWKKNDYLVGNANRRDNIINLVKKTNSYLMEKSKEDKLNLFEQLKNKKLNKKYQTALDLFIGMYFSKDRKNIGNSFRNWRIGTVKKNLETMTYRLLARIMNNMIGVNDNLNTKEKLEKHFNIWKKKLDSKNKATNALYQFLNRVFHSAYFHKRHIRNNIDDLLDIAQHFSLINKNKAQKLGNFLSGILLIFRRINLMKRQKALMETYKKLNFLSRMTIISALNRWKNRSSKIANNEHANILQDFIRKIVGQENSKELAIKKAKNVMDNFAIRFGLFRLSDTAKLNRIYNILMKLFDSIPKELRKRALMMCCIRWRRNAEEIKRINASNMIIKCLRGYIMRKFALKLLLKKYAREDMARRMFKTLVGLKLFYYSEWKRRARILELKANSSAMGVWMSGKFNGFKLLKSKRGLGELFQQYLNKTFLDALKKAASINPHRDQILVDTINKIYRNPPGRLMLDCLRKKFFKKKYGQLFGTIIRNLRHLHVYYYADHWRNKVMDVYYARLIKLQSWVRMVLARLKAKRELRKLALTTKIFRKLGLDGKMAVMLYTNLWRAYCRYLTLCQEGEVLAKLILFHNANVDYDKDVAQNHLQKIFKNYFVRNIKNGIIEAKNYKDNVRDAIKNFNSQIERQYSVNNLVDYGRDSLRRMLLQMIFGVQDTLAQKSKLRQAIDRWRFYNEKLIQFVIRIQTIWRGKKIRDMMNRLWKVKDIMLRMLSELFTDKDKLRSRTIMWRNRAVNLAATTRATTIQNFLKNHMIGFSKKVLANIFNNGYRKHFTKCIGNLGRFKKLKDAMSRPWNRESMNVITKKATYHKIAERFRYIMGFSDKSNRLWIIREMAKKWNLRAHAIKEHEMFSALLIVASIRAKLTKIKVQRFKELNSAIRFLLFKAFGDEKAMRLFAITQWLNYTRKRMLMENRENIAGHAKEILEKIRNSKDADRKAKFLRAQELLKKFIGRLMLRSHFGLGLENTRNNKLQKLDDIYRNVYRRNINHAYKRIKLYALYRENLLKKLQRRWRFYKKFQNLLQKIMIMKLIVKLALNNDLQKKHSTILYWRKQLLRMNTINKGNILQKFYRDMMDHLREKKNSSYYRLRDLLRNYILRQKILKPLHEFDKWNSLANVEKIMRKSHLRFLNEKSLLLYILNLICGFYNKCEKKLIQSAMFRFRFNALHSRDKASNGRLLNLVKEVSRRRHQNKVREVMVRLVKGRSYDEKDIQTKFYAHWCRNAETLRAQEQADIVGNYLAKQKRRLDFKKKWMSYGVRISALNGIFGARYLLDQANKLRRITPLVNCIYRRNTALNGDDFLIRLRNISVLLLLKESFLPLMGQSDLHLKLIHAKHWNNQAHKLLRRDQLLTKLGNSLQDTFSHRAFNLVRSACILKYNCKLAEIVQKHHVLSLLKKENQHVLNIKGFANGLVKAQSKIFENSSSLFKDKIYKFYVYKILANMGDIFLKQQQYNKIDFYKQFFYNFNSLYAPFKTNSKIFVDKLKPIIHNHNNKINNKVNNVLAFLSINKLTRKNLGKFAFKMFENTFTDSANRGRLYTILRLGYLKKQLTSLLDANKFLKFNYIAKLYSTTIAMNKVKKITKGIKEWRFKNQNINILEEKMGIFNDTINNFSESVKDGLLTGRGGIINLFKKFQNTDGVNPNTLNKKKEEEGKRYVENLKNKSQKLKTMKTQNNNNTNTGAEESKISKELKPQETMVQGKIARSNLKN